MGISRTLHGINRSGLVSNRATNDTQPAAQTLVHRIAADNLGLVFLALYACFATVHLCSEAIFKMQLPASNPQPTTEQMRVTELICRQNVNRAIFIHD